MVTPGEGYVLYEFHIKYGELLFESVLKPWLSENLATLNYMILEVSARSGACGIAVFNRRVSRLCVRASVSLQCTVIEESSTELVRFQVFELSRKEDKIHV